ncbi:hypothetical protein ACWCQ1_43780 [Streptomyces sp. NPDC002144]
MTDRPHFGSKSAFWPPMVVSAALLLGAGCTSTHPTASTKTYAPSSASATTQTPAEETPTDQAATDSGDSFTVGLHKSAVWNDGVEARLSNLTRGVSSNVAAPANTPMIRFTVTVTNGSTSPLDLSLLDIECPTDDGMIYDEGLDSAPNRHALPGKSVAWASACAFGRAEHDFQLEITPGSEDLDVSYRTAIFTGQVP